MEFADVVRTRCSVRAFQEKSIEAAKFDVILEAINAAPSAGNLQGYDVVRIEDPAARSRLAEASRQTFIVQAPIVLVFCANARRSGAKYGRRGEALYAIQDATIAAAYAQLAAVDEGLATVWVGAFDEAAVTGIIGAPAHIRPVAILLFGYAAEQPKASSRRMLEDLIRREKF